MSYDAEDHSADRYFVLGRRRGQELLKGVICVFLL
jgi:hypothetical protein